MRHRRKGLLALLLLIARPLCAQSDPTLAELSIEELMNVRIVSASNTAERLSDAPATVIVLTRDEIERRGYRDLSGILDDLPGMDVVRPHGDTWLKNYWRGYRNTIGDPFLIMIDGVVFNHLYFNTADVMATFPLTNVDRIEVVYGPASSVYGANAFMGVINVITIDDQSASGSSERVRLAAGASNARQGDASYFYKQGDIRFSIAARMDNGTLDPSSGERYEYTRNRYYGDRALWGGFVDTNFAGRFDSAHSNRALDVRLRLGTLELAAQYFRLEAGYGNEYAADRAQNNGVWARPELSFYARQSRDLNDRVRSTTLVRYRSSDVSNDSFFVEEASSNPRKLDFSYWQSLNSSVSLFQDFDVRLNPRVSLTAGLKYEQKDLQKAYEVTYGPALPPDQVTGSGYPYPHPPRVLHSRIESPLKTGACTRRAGSSLPRDSGSTSAEGLITTPSTAARRRSAPVMWQTSGGGPPKPFTATRSRSRTTASFMVVGMDRAAILRFVPNARGPSS